MLRRAQDDFVKRTSAAAHDKPHIALQHTS